MESLCPALQDCVNSVKNKFTNHSSVPQNFIKGKIVIEHSPGKSGPGKSASVQVYSRTKVDDSTGRGKLSEKAYLKNGKSHKHDGTRTTTYEMKFLVEPEFGIPGAFIIENQHKHKFFIQSATLHMPGDEVIHFDCRSWVYPFKLSKTSRIFFCNTSYLPRDTPAALDAMRQEELETLKGDAHEERKEWDRVYGFEYYNDLGNPDKGAEHARPVTGGRQHPYPRRLKTARPKSKADRLTESKPEKMINLDIYVPPDDRFSPKKMDEFMRNSIQAFVHFLLPDAKSLLKDQNSSFKSFDEIKGLFSGEGSHKMEGWLIEKLQKLMPDDLLKRITHASKAVSLKFPLPQIVAENELAWKEDEEFGRQMLAGTNPTRIRCLEQFPPNNSSINASHIENSLDGLTINQAMKQWRIYILDHYDYLMPYLNRINAKGNVCAYASRTLLFLKSDATLKPIAIELSLPPPTPDSEMAFNKVYLPAKDGTDGALWQLVKTHVAANDSAYHHLVSHWLHTHAVVEPFIISARRQLSTMHPIHKLLDPHFKDTMHINALARTVLLNAGGIFEKILYPGEICMELSSELYKEWRLDHQALPTDLIKRRLALEDSDNPTGAQILFQDYPYGLDGLSVWYAINKWVTDYCSIFYKDDEALRLDEEVQEWWSEVRNIGHADKWNEKWWTEMTNLNELTSNLSTLIWIASALHASVNFGQYAYAGYPPNRPTLCRKFIPQEGTKEFGDFLADPDKYFLEMLPGRFEMTLGIALAEVLSRHTSDELYVGQRPSTEWTDNKEVLQKFEEFNKTLKEIEDKIMDRNTDPKLKNRWGPAKIPFRLLQPDTANRRRIGGITGRGIPNSISI